MTDFATRCEEAARELRDWASRREAVETGVGGGVSKGTNDLNAVANLLTEAAAMARECNDRDRDWILAIGYALGTDSGFDIPIVPEVEPFKRLFAAIRDTAPNEGTVRDAERFNHLQNCLPVDAQAFFWNYSSRKQRAKAIDAAIDSSTREKGHEGA